ncbi:MAG TPA: PQQ-binding-like beta-propeller repeat protein [Gemmataceae bacterium]|nr:PQQ-binding-like beta-propeller repeat protein [Gemmataceae bacterium]
MIWIRGLVACLLCAAIAQAGDWPQWLGPNRDGSSAEVVAAWKESPKVLWRHPAGEGNSSPVVAQERVFIHAKVKDKNEETVVALDAATGKELWQSTHPRAEFKSLFGNGPRATPAVAGDNLYTFGITGVLRCQAARTGKQLWEVDTLKEFGAQNLRFGMSCSPLVDADRVLVNVGGKDASVVAFNKDTGAVVWKALADRASYSSPIVLGQGKERQIIFLTQQGLVSLNPSDGSLFWRFPLMDLLLESSSTPVRAGDFLVASSITYGSVGLRLEAKDDKPSATQVWKNDSLTCYFSTPVAVGAEHLYLVSGTKPPAFSTQATLHCIDIRTGKELWRRAKVGKYHAALLRTGNQKLLLLEEAGDLVLLDPDPKEYRELARSKICGETWAHPALANGRLYVRDNKEVVCLQLPE